MTFYLEMSRSTPKTVIIIQTGDREKSVVVQYTTIWQRIVGQILLAFMLTGINLALTVAVSIFLIASHGVGMDTFGYDYDPTARMALFAFLLYASFYCKCIFTESCTPSMRVMGHVVVDEKMEPVGFFKMLLRGIVESCLAGTGLGGLIDVCMAIGSSVGGSLTDSICGTHVVFKESLAKLN
jgi:uncharacterized RDD family membrane protein YckC